MTVEEIAVMRADEQARSVRAESFRYVHERDGWDVPASTAPKRKHRRTRCLGCGDKVRGATSYCARCGHRINRGLPWDSDLYESRGLRRARKGTN